MSDNNIFQTYLFISPKKFSIDVFSDEKKRIYEKKFILNEKNNDLNFVKLDNFLNENIFKIEKILNNFVKNIYVILESNNLFSIELSVKKDNYKNKVDLKSLDYLLNDAKNYCKKTIDDRKILHIIIQNYQIDDKDYSFLPKDIEANFFSLDLKFISISNNDIKNLENTLRKYQIFLKKVVSANYVTEFFGKSGEDICILSQK